MGRSTKHPGLYKRQAYWWLRCDPVSGKAVSTRCTSLKAALAVQAERERLAADPAYATSQSATLGDYCARFISLKESSKKAQATVQFYREKLGHPVRIFGIDAPLATFVPVVFDSYLAQRREEGASDHTISKEVKALISVLKSAKRVGAFTGELDVLHPEGLTANYVPRDRAMDLLQVSKLEAEVNPVLAGLMLVSVALGLRLSEACKISPDHIDLEAGLVHIEGTKTKGSRRLIPIVSAFRPMLERALPVLPIGDQPHNLHRDYKSAAKRAGIEHVSPNDFRRSHATILAELGARAEDTRKLLGHTSTQMVDRVYAKPRALEVGALVERSIRVATDAETACKSAVTNLSKSLKSQMTHQEKPMQDRTSNPRVSGSTPLGRAASTLLPRRENHKCSSGVAVEEIAAPAWALGYAALVVGVLPANKLGAAKGAA